MRFVTSLNHVEDIWTPEWFATEVERQLTAALARERASAARKARRAKAGRAAQQERVAPQIEAARRSYIEAHPNRPRATPSIQLADWFSDAPRASGEEQDTHPDDPDHYNRTLAQRFARGGLESVASFFYGLWKQDLGREFHDAEAMWRLALSTARDEMEGEAGSVPFRTQDEILTDQATVEWLSRDDAPAARVAWTVEDENRVTLMNLRYAYRDALHRPAARKSLAIQKLYAAPAIKWQAEALKARWAFQAELLRHGLRNDAAAVRIFKPMLGRRYDIALDEAKIARRRSKKQPFAAARMNARARWIDGVLVDIA